MNYTLNQLRIFVKVVETKSVTKAAEELHLTQPAVSIQLKNFQDQFDFPLIEVLNKRLFITDFGLEIVESAKRILHEVQSIDYKKHAFKGALTGKLNFSIVSTGKYVAPYFVADFIKSNPAVTLNLDVTNKAQVVQSLADNTCDFALVSVLPDHMQVESLPLLQNKLYLVGNKDQVFGKKMYTQKILEKLPIIYREKGSGTRYVMERFVIENKLPIQKQLELTSNEAVKQAVIAGLGYSIMPLIGIKNELENGQLQIIPIQGFPIESVWCLIWLKNKQLNPLSQAYLNFLRENKSKIIGDVFSWYEQFI